MTQLWDSLFSQNHETWLKMPKITIVITVFVVFFFVVLCALFSNESQLKDVGRFWPIMDPNAGQVLLSCLGTLHTPPIERKENVLNHHHNPGFFRFFPQFVFLVLAKSPRSARKYCNTGATAQEREQARRLIHGCGSNITVNLICYRVTSTRD